MKVIRTINPIAINVIGAMTGTTETIVECRISKKTIVTGGDTLTYYTYYDSLGNVIKTGESVGNIAQTEALFDQVKGDMPDINLGFMDYIDELFLKGSAELMVATFPELTAVTDLQIIDIP